MPSPSVKRVPVEAVAGDVPVGSGRRPGPELPSTPTDMTTLRGLVGKASDPTFRTFRARDRLRRRAPAGREIGALRCPERSMSCWVAYPQGAPSFSRAIRQLESALAN